MRVFGAAVLLAIALLLASSCSNDTSLATVPPATVPPTPTLGPSEVVAVDDSPVAGSTPANKTVDAEDPQRSSAAQQATDTDNRLLVRNISIAVPSTWVVVNDQTALNDLVQAGRLSTLPDSIDQATLAEWSGLIEEHDVMLAVNPANGQSATLILSPRLGGLSPNNDPEGWISAMQDLTAGTVAGSTYSGVASSAGFHNGVRSKMSAPPLAPTHTIEQFSTLIDDQLVTITVTAVDYVSSTDADAIIDSLLLS